MITKKEAIQQIKARFEMIKHRRDHYKKLEAFDMVEIQEYKMNELHLCLMILYDIANEKI